jgi:hypothetical protein
MPPGRRWMRRARGRFAGGRHSIAVHFGPVVRVGEGDDRIAVMERVRLAFEAAGAVTTPDKRMAARTSSAPAGE